MNKVIYHFFDDDEFLRISNAIKEAELSTSGEIRVSLREKRKFSERNTLIKNLAEKEFYRLNMHQTRDRTGILMLFILEDRQFYILADEGINKLVGETAWQGIATKMQDDFSHGYFAEGIINGIIKIGEILSEHFPIKPDDVNELTNKVVLPKK